MWTAAGEPSAGAAAGSTAGVVPTSSTTGAIAFTDAGAGITSYLARLQAMGTTQPLCIALADRLYHKLGILGNEHRRAKRHRPTGADSARQLGRE